MQKIALVYGNNDSYVTLKAMELLSQFLLDYTGEYPICTEYENGMDLSDYTCIYIGKKSDNCYIAENSEAVLSHNEEYYISVKNGNVIIEGYDDNGLLYGCIDFYNKYILKYEFPHDPDRYCLNPFERVLPDFEYSSYPSVKNRGLWTWGHVIYDYKGYIDNMLLLKMNTLIIWNDFVPVNAKQVVKYAHECGIKVIWGFAWGWDVKCDEFSFENMDGKSRDIFLKYEKEYADIKADGIYFQSFTELRQEKIKGVLIAEAVTDFVNNTAKLFYEKYPDIELQFGLHANSVSEKLDYIKNVDSRIRIVWENCGAFPFSYLPSDLDNFDSTLDFSLKTAVLRGENDKYGVVIKGFTKLDWGEFKHIDGSFFMGTGTEFYKNSRIVRKSKIWKYLQAYWLTNADKAYEMIRELTRIKKGDLYITALAEDGMFEENIMFPIALYSEMLWNCDRDYKAIINEVALRNYVKFA